MTYINHLTNFYKIVEVDERLYAFHISLYMALFQLWNKNRFKLPICIYRDTVMGLSKIGSTHTYYKCLHELQEWNYLEYIPSKNGMFPSYVNLFVIDDLFITKFNERKSKNDISKTQTMHQHLSKNDTSNTLAMHRNSSKTNTSKTQAVLPFIEIKDNIDIIDKKDRSENSTSSKKTILNEVDLKKIKIKNEVKVGKEKRKKVPLKKEKDIKLPFSSDSFVKHWNELLLLPKWKKKPQQSILSTLTQIANYDEEFAICLIKTAISNNWQGLVFTDTDSHYSNWLKNKHAKTDETTHRQSPNNKKHPVQNSEPIRNYTERF